MHHDFRSYYRALQLRVHQLSIFRLPVSWLKTTCIYQYMTWAVCRSTTHTPETLLTLSKAQVEASIRRWGELSCTTVCVYIYVHAKRLCFVLGHRNSNTVYRFI
jgi:hypothetical protein